jgi:hypothetical protein
VIKGTLALAKKHLSDYTASAILRHQSFAVPQSAKLSGKIKALNSEITTSARTHLAD